MFESLKGNWNLFRVIRVAIGVFIIAQGVYAYDTFSIVLGSVFGGMALFNVGCCGANGCATDIHQTSKSVISQEISYEEVVDKK